jgi:hypothetical protein
VKGLTAANSELLRKASLAVSAGCGGLVPQALWWCWLQAPLF